MIKKLELFGKIKVDIFEDGFDYHIDNEEIQEALWDYIYHNVSFAAKNSVKNYKLTLEEIE